MNTAFKKLVVLLPVFVISLFDLRVLYHEHYSVTSSKRVFGLVVSVLLLYALMIIIVARKRQQNFLQVMIQSSFFVYVFAVLQLTGYFILFREISSNDWWGKMNHRIETHDHVNFKIFDTMNRYSLYSKQMIGNFIMLLPLGIFLPLLHKRLRKFSSFFIVLII